MSKENKTQYFELPLPHKDNTLAFDEPRIEQAIGKIDTILHEHADALTGNASDVSTLRSNVSGLADRVTELEENGGGGSGGGTGGVFVSTPEITCGDEAAVGYTTDISLSASPLLQNVSITKFVVTYDGGAEQMITASDGSAVWHLTVPASATVGSVVAITVVAVDGVGNRSLVATKDLTLVDTHVQTPTLTLSQASIYPNASVTLTGSAYAVHGNAGTLTDCEFALFTSQDLSGTKAWSASGSTDLSATIPADTLDPGIYYAAHRQQGSNVGWSLWSTPVTLTIRTPIVVAPQIITPAAGASIVKQAGLALSLNAFDCEGGTDTQKSFTGVICSDAAATTPLITKNVAGTGVSYTFGSDELSSLVAGNNYYVKAMREGNKYGASAYSDIRTISVSDGISSHGCVIYPNSDGKTGTIIAKNRDGSPLKLIVPYCKYRTKAKFGAYGKDNPDLPNCTDYFYIYNNAGYDKTQGVPASVTMDYLIQNFAEKNKNELSAKVQTESWYNTYKNSTDSQSITGVPAVEFCINLTEIDGNPFFMGNSWDNMILWMVSNDFDTIDPFKSQYAQNLLGSDNPSGRFYVAGAGVVWCSTESNSSRCLYVYCDGHVNVNGKNNEFGVVPLRELAA